MPSSWSTGLRVGAKPHPSAGTPGGWTGLVYYRLHGSPKMYYSAYSQEVIADTAGTLGAHAQAGREAWCIFDNTAAFAATGDALSAMELLHSHALKKR